MHPFFLRLVSLVGTMLLSAWVPPAGATQKSADEEVSRITDNLLKQKVSVIERHGGLLHLGESRSFNVFLDKGKIYYFIVGGCTDASDLDVGVGDESGMLKTDQTTDRMAFVEFTAPASKNYTVTARMAASAPDGAHFTLLICRPPEQSGTFAVSSVTTTPPTPNTPSLPPPVPPAPPIPTNTPRPVVVNTPAPAIPSPTPTARPAPPAGPELMVDLDTKFETEEGGVITLKELTSGSKAVYIRIWSSWCRFCKQLDPNLAYRQNVLEKEKIKVVALNAFDPYGQLKGDPAAVRKARKENKIPKSVPIYVQLEPHKFTTPLNVQGVPNTVLIDRHGKVLFNGHPLDPALVPALLELGVTDFDLRAGL